MTGGMIWPLTELATSTEPAFSAVKPTRFIRGMVKVPVVTTLAIDEPEIRPVIIDARTAALAGPPRRCPRSAKASLMKKLPAPARSSIEPNRTNRKTKAEDTPSATPNTPFGDSHIWSIARETDAPPQRMMSGSHGDEPKKT